MVSVDESKGVLEALLTAYPNDGVVLGIRMWSGWGNTLQVEVHTGHEAGAGRHVERRTETQIRQSILEELASSRPMVTVIPLDLRLHPSQSRLGW